MSYSQQPGSFRGTYPQGVDRRVTGEFNPFDVPFDVIFHELNALGDEFSLTPLKSLLSEGFEDLDDLKAAIAELSDYQLAQRILAEIDIIIDDYRKGIALL